MEQKTNEENVENDLSFFFFFLSTVEKHLLSNQFKSYFSKSVA